MTSSDCTQMPVQQATAGSSALLQVTAVSYTHLDVYKRQNPTISLSDQLARKVGSG